MAEPESPSPDALVSRFRDGEPGAVAEVAGIVRAAVHSRGFFIPSDERSEVIQEALVHLWRLVTDPDQEAAASFAALVRAVAYRRCVDWMRRHVRTEPVVAEVAAAPDDPETALLQHEQARIGRWALEALDDRCRDVIWMHTAEDLTFREIAQRQGRLEKTVRNQMYKCLQKARDLIERMRRRERLGLDAFGGTP